LIILKNWKCYWHVMFDLYFQLLKRRWIAAALPDLEPELKLVPAVDDRSTGIGRLMTWTWWAFAPPARVRAATRKKTTHLTVYRQHVVQHTVASVSVTYPMMPWHWLQPASGLRHFKLQRRDCRQERPPMQVTRKRTRIASYLNLIYKSTQKLTSIFYTQWKKVDQLCLVFWKKKGVHHQFVCLII
jgi:hypothetical protein